MHCPALVDLPPPPPGKAGWPWTVETPPLPLLRPDGSPWPRISIVTPSYNQGEFIEETIRSVLLQGYPDLEYIVIDGGSDDDSVTIVKKYKSWLTYWTSEKDRGQSHAINKGLALATGSLFNWLNSDDLLLPSALGDIAVRFDRQDALAFAVVNFDDAGETTIANRSLSPNAMISGQDGTSFHQPGVWLSVDRVRCVGALDECFHYAFDHDLLIRYLHRFPNIEYIDRPVARFRLHERSKTCSYPNAFWEDRMAACRKYLGNPEYSSLHSTCRKTLRVRMWWRRLDEILGSSEPKFSKVSKIVYGMISDPQTWVARPSFGALRRVIFGQ